ncbi:aa3-type cytochrome c oxidase subunit IV [Tsuneonella suprasediminis]|uniref:Aa3-type cytochrome c oxidase subunit IV n=1 Tax=Tsuneonella suprasediminis TaxID=2306996 RepID=A0A419QZ74_9SPHN|nr:aa3-type cytochrome c oxidase subunit IV [Tsuneonella suprasediminis]RJX65929.1 aa3-type cytochrome c oxidase subunit IV [Tsuneonella suprasediminis]UBS32571.1 aa3-type cytochrome c oxidase subunit IV [Altererythrobacter sp. N1]
MASANDMKEHEGTYDGFIGLVKISVPVLIIIVALVVLAIAS